MVIARLRDHDKLDEASTFGVLKAKMLFLFDEFGMKEFARTFFVIPSNPIFLHEYRSGNSKENRMILNGVRNKFVPHIAENNTVKEMLDAFIKLYQDLKEKM